MKSVLAANSGGKADVHVKEGDKIKFGHEHLDVLATPGHTDGGPFLLLFVLITEYTS